MFEYTTYANHYYGSRKSDVEAILAEGHHVLTVMDICGAMALKTHFPDVVTVYIKREKRELLTSILERNIPTQDKVNRLLAIEAEKQNAEICDYVVQMHNPQQAAKEIRNSLHLC
jgi:guanylate kinase